MGAYTDDRMDYTIGHEDDNEKVERFKRVWRDLRAKIGFCTANIELLWNYYRTTYPVDHIDMQFVQHHEIPDLDFEWWGDKQRPYKFWERQTDITYDVARLHALYEIVDEQLQDNVVPTKKVWYRLLRWSHNFIGFSRCEIKDSHITD